MADSELEVKYTDWRSSNLNTNFHDGVALNFPSAKWTSSDFNKPHRYICETSHNGKEQLVFQILFRNISEGWIINDMPKF